MFCRVEVLKITIQFSSMFCRIEIFEIVVHFSSTELSQFIKFEQTLDSFVLCNLHTFCINTTIPLSGSDFPLFFSPDRLPSFFLLVMEVIFRLLGSLSSWRAGNSNGSELYNFGCFFTGLHPSKVSCHVSRDLFVLILKLLKMIVNNLHGIWFILAHLFQFGN